MATALHSETITIGNRVFHLPFSDLLPPLTEEEYQDLKEDISRNGIIVPIEVARHFEFGVWPNHPEIHYDVLDGQHRLEIAVELGLGAVPLQVNHCNDDEGRRELAWNLNAHRRHMTPDQRREMAFRLRLEGMSYREIGDRLGVDHATAIADVKSAGGEFSPPQTVTGRDGKQYPAVMPPRADPVSLEPESDTLTPDVDPDTGEVLMSGRRKPKTNRAADEYTPQGFDLCQTPPEALEPLLPYLRADWTIWEPAAGEGLLVEALYDSGYRGVVGTDIQLGQNFFEYEPEQLWDCLVTNPPYSLKYRWLERCYTLDKPFALLIPVETLGAKTAQVLFREHGLEVIFMDRRINFKMPKKGWDGSAAQFPVAWFTWGLEIGQQMTFAHLREDD